MTPDHRPDEFVDGPDGGATDLADGREVTTVVTWNAAELRMEIETAAGARRVPLLMAAVTAGVGVAAWSAVQVVGAVGGPEAWSVAGALVWVCTAVALPVLWSRLRHRIPARWSRTWWVAAVCAVVWVDVVATRGADLLAPGVAIGLLATLILVAATLGARWADEHEVPNPGDIDIDEEPGPAPIRVSVPRAPQVDTSDAEVIEQDWDAEVAHGRNPLAPESVLHHRAELPHGWRWTVQLDRGGSVGCTELENDGITARVALKLAKRPTHVMLERLDGPLDREDRAQLTVITRDVLADGVRYVGPRYDRGTIPIGAYGDGAGEAVWRAYDTTGVLCGLVTGGQGSGKSALMAALGLGYRRSGEWTVVFGDGDEGGNSSTLLADVAHDFAAGPEQVLAQLEAMEAWGRLRGHLMKTLADGPDGRPTPMSSGRGQRPVVKMLPCGRYPATVWFIDEFYRLAKDPWLQSRDFVDRVEKVVRIQRKYGGAVVVGTQSQLGDDFDGNSALRAMLASGNSVALRSMNRSEEGIVNDGFSPRLLPKGGGYAFLGEGDRRAMIRTEFSEDMDIWLPEVLAYGRPDQRSWAAYRRYRPEPKVDLDSSFEASVAALDAFDAAVATGAPLPGSPEARAAVDDDAPGIADVEVSVAGLGIPTLAPVVPIRPEPAVVDERSAVALPENARRVHEALLSRPGAWRSAELVEESGMSASAVSKALRVLVDRGLAHRPLGVRGVHAAGPGAEQGTAQAR